MSEAVIVGAAVAGESAALRAELQSLIQNIDKQTLDVAERLYIVQSKGLYQPEFNTYMEFTKDLGLKESKARYLPKIVKVMGEVGIPRTQYEKLTIARLRQITSLDPSAMYHNPLTNNDTPMKEFIVGFVEKNEEIEFNDLVKHVRTLKGFTGENDITWLNLPFVRSALENTVRPGIEKVKAVIGSIGKDEDGISKDASDSAAVEAAFAHILTDDTFGVESAPEPHDSEG